MKFSKLKYFVVALLLSFIACKPKHHIKKVEHSSLQYANGFTYQKHKKHTVITVLKPFKGSTTPLEYILITGDTIVQATQANQIVVKAPIKKLIATSTTQIPILEALNSEMLLKGFPNTNFVSSKKTRALIDNKKIINIGHEQNINIELALDIEPDVLFAFGVNNLNKSIATLKNAGIPIVIDASWLEESPLGRAEWIKFFALFLNKEKEASLIFKEIENNYNEAKKLVQHITLEPQILYGGIYNGVWYAPAGDSFVAQILNDAKTNYIWKETKGTGSLSLQFENVFLEAKDTDFWFAPGYAANIEALGSKNKHYKQFAPYTNNKIYSYTNTTGATGGLLFFELGALRPDFILKDVIKICHPEILPDYETTFFRQLN